MIPSLICNFKELLDSLNFISGTISLFWIVEYSPNELGYEGKTIEYDNDLNRYSFLRTECLKHPTDYQERLNNKQYRIWTVVPQDLDW